MEHTRVTGRALLLLAVASWSLSAERSASAPPADPAAVQDHVPTELIKLCHSRNLENLEIRWVHDAPLSWFDRSRQGRYRIWQINRYYGDNGRSLRSWHNLGDDEGLVLVGQRGEPYSYDPMRLFIDDKAGTVVEAQDTQISCQKRFGVYELNAVPDPRTLGLLPWYRNNTTPEEALERIASSMDQFTVQRKPSETLITGWNSSSPWANRVQWTIDPTGEYVYSCVSLSPEGVPSEECVCEYDGSPIPKAVRFSSDGALEHKIGVVYVNEGHLTNLTMADELQMFPGRQIYTRAGKTFWDGSQENDGDFGEMMDSGALDLRRYNELLATHGVVLGRSPRPVMQEVFGDILFEEGFASPASVRLWEPYTRAFVAHYDFDKTQQDRAEDILNRAQTYGYEFLDEHENADAEFDERIATVAKSNDSRKAEKIKSLNDARARAFAPLQLIFRRELRARLYRLLTEEQNTMSRFDSDERTSKN